MEGEKVYHIIFIRSWNNFSANNIQLLQQQNDLMLKYHFPNPFRQLSFHRSAAQCQQVDILYYANPIKNQHSIV